jgi:hypothetical protein
MRRHAQRLLLFPLLVVALAMPMAPTLATAQPPAWAAPLELAANSDATLYEATENMRLTRRGSLAQSRKATSELMGVVRRGSPLCPVVAPGTGHCTVNATGHDTINLTTGMGSLDGTLTVVVQDTNLVDSPEVVVMKGKFLGTIDFTPALFLGLPFGTAEAHLVVNGVGRIPFTGTFRQPISGATLPDFLNPCPTTDRACAVYFAGFTNSHSVPVPEFVLVQPNEFALSFAAVRFEITLHPLEPERARHSRGRGAFEREDDDH